MSAQVYAGGFPGPVPPRQPGAGFLPGAAAVIRAKHPARRRGKAAAPGGRRGGIDKEADQLPTDSKESFQQAANKIGESVNSSVAGIQDPFRDQGQQLDALAAKDPACQQTQG